MKASRVYRAVLIFGVWAACWGSAAPRLTSEKAVVEKFCDLDARGGQLSSEGRKELNELFTRPVQSRPETAIIIKDFVVLGPSKSDGSEFEVEYIYLGRLNLSSARYSRLPPPYPSSPIKVRASFNLIYGSTESGSSEWRIKGGPPEPRITVETAIHYLTELERQSSDMDIKKKAEKTIATLRRLL